MTIALKKYKLPDGTEAEVPWQQRRNAVGWIRDNEGKLHAIPFRCEICSLGSGCYGDEDGIHCVSCWVAKKTTAN